MAKEDGDHGIPFDVVQSPLLEEDVSFINQDYRSPGGRDLENTTQSGVDLRSSRSEVCCTYHIQRL